MIGLIGRIQRQRRIDRMTAAILAVKTGRFVKPIFITEKMLSRKMDMYGDEQGIKISDEKVVELWSSGARLSEYGVAGSVAYNRLSKMRLPSLYVQGDSVGKISRERYMRARDGIAFLKELSVSESTIKRARANLERTYQRNKEE